MLNLEDFMNIRDLKQQGWSVSAIAGALHLDRKTVRKHLLEAPQPYKRENPAPCKIDPFTISIEKNLDLRRDFGLVSLLAPVPHAMRDHVHVSIHGKLLGFE